MKYGRKERKEEGRTEVWKDAFPINTVPARCTVPFNCTAGDTAVAAAAVVSTCIFDCITLGIIWQRCNVMVTKTITGRVQSRAAVGLVLTCSGDCQARCPLCSGHRLYPFLYA